MAVWQGEDGNWSDAASWSSKQPPGAGSGLRPHVCVSGPVTVTIGPESGRVDLAALVLAEGAKLIIEAGAGLFVWDESDTSFSIVRADATIDVAGGTLGGPGTLVVRGSVSLSPAGGVPATLGTSDTHDADQPGGQLVVDDQGRLEVTGSGASRLTTGYSMEVRGIVHLTSNGALAADHGTSFALRDRDRREGVGTLRIENDYGYSEGLDNAEPLGTFRNEGSIVKIGPPGVSRISADYSASDKGSIVVDEGSLALPDGTYTRADVAPGATYGSGVCDEASTDCGVGTTADRPQLAWLTLPANEEGGALVVVTPVDDPEAGGLGSAVKAHARDLDVTRAWPAVIALRYDSTLLVRGDGSLRAWSDLRVKHEDGPGGYQVIDACTRSGDLPTNDVACLDRAETKSRSTQFETDEDPTNDGDVVMVVRTIRTSRWIVD